MSFNEMAHKLDITNIWSDVSYFGHHKFGASNSCISSKEYLAQLEVQEFKVPNVDIDKDNIEEQQEILEI